MLRCMHTHIVMFYTYKDLIQPSRSFRDFEHGEVEARGLVGNMGTEEAALELGFSSL